MQYCCLTFVIVKGDSWLKKIYTVEYYSTIIKNKVKVKVAQLCLTPCDSMEFSRILEWVAVLFSRGSS